MLETELLFDDAAVLEARFGEGCLNITSANANCDCTGYTFTQDDEDINTSKGPGINS